MNTYNGLAFPAQSNARARRDRLERMAARLCFGMPGTLSGVDPQQWATVAFWLLPAKQK